MHSGSLRSYLTSLRKDVHAALLPSDPGSGEVVHFEVDVDLPQRPLHPINEIEQIRVTFKDDSRPEIVLSRENFPVVPHLIQGRSDPIREICLYERPWSEEESNWSPSAFVERIRRWLSDTANGSLHRGDQPLEPLLFQSPYKLVLPRDSIQGGKSCWIQNFYLSVRGDRKQGAFCVCYTEKRENEKTLNLPLVFVQMPASTHGIIQKTPLTLKDLEMLTTELGASIIELICTELGTVMESLKDPEVMKSKLILVLQLPKQREAGGKVELYEYQAFYLNEVVGELLKVDTNYSQKEGTIFVPSTVERIRDPKKMESVALLPLSVRFRLTRKAGAEMNGVTLTPLKIVVIGVGSLGSQVVNNLARGGMGSWTLVDPDDLEPHNPARHLLPSCAVGFKKAECVADFLHQIFDLDESPLAISCDYLAPGEDEAQMTAALKDADVILDFSASVAVGRELSLDHRSEARRICCFLNQRGDELVTLTESKERSPSLIWLEAEYYRAVALDTFLDGHFDQTDKVAHRYGNACRELSAVFRQDYVAAFAGIAAIRVRHLISEANANVSVHRLDPASGEIFCHAVDVSTPVTVMVGEWKVLVHPKVCEDLNRIRQVGLPAETGGVLQGVVDRKRKYIAIVCAQPAPPDSEAYPTSFIRGCSGLAATVAKIANKTLGNIVYVGEWHSHPQGHSVKASDVDWEAIQICSPYMEADGLPTTMLIVGDNGSLNIACKLLGKDEVTEVSLSPRKNRKKGKL